MKKSIILFAVALGMLTSCDPIKEDKDFDVTNITAEGLLNGAQFSQYADEACTTPKDNGNFIKFNCPNTSGITIYYIKPDGSEAVLSSGKPAGVFNFVPMRGSDPNQTLYFRYINQDGEEVVAQKQFTVEVAADLAPEVKLLVSDDGKKTWKWNTNAPDGQVWGNMGDGGGNYNNRDFALKGSGKWWGVTSTEEFEGQAQHCADGYIGDHDMNATMVFNEDGTITCYDKDGNQIRKGNFKVTDWNPAAENGKIGVLHTDAGSILWPYQINWKNNNEDPKPTWFEIAYLSPSRLVLIYPDYGKWGADWQEATFWQFYSDTDIKGVLTDNDQATWTWDDDDAKPCWGNGGYGGLVYGGKSSLTGNSWWGVDTGSIDEQISNYGYGLADGKGATMTFTKDGLIKKSSGGNGSFTYDMSNKSDLGGYNEGKTWGRLKTEGDGILFPVRINTSAENKWPAASEFDIVYFDDDHVVLAHPNYPKGGDNASWMEGTFWRFKKQK